MDQHPSFSALLIAALRRHGWFVVVAVLGTLAAAAAIVSSQAEVHRASMKLVVSQAGVLSPELRDSVVPVTQTLKSLLGSNSLAEEVIRTARVDETPESLLDDLTVSNLADSSVIDVSYDDTDPAIAARVLAAVGSVFSEAVGERFGGAASDGGLQVEVFDPPHVHPDPVSPRPVLTLVVAGLLGIVLGVAGALAAARMDRRLRGRRRVEQALRLPVVAEFSRRTVADVNPETDADAGAVGLLREAVLGQAPSCGLVAVMGVTSGRPEPTAVAALLATALARVGEDVVVLDGDVRRSCLADLLDLDRETAGLADALSGSLEIEDAMLELAIDSGRSVSGRRLDQEWAGSPRVVVRTGSGDGPAPGPETGSAAPADPPVREAREYYEKELADYRRRTPPGPETRRGRLQAVVSGRDRATAGAITEAAAMPLVDRLGSGRRRLVVAVPPIWDTADGIPLMRVASSIVLVAVDGRTTRDDAVRARGALERLGLEPGLVVLVRGRSRNGGDR